MKHVRLSALVGLASTVKELESGIRIGSADRMNGWSNQEKLEERLIRVVVR